MKLNNNGSMETGNIICFSISSNVHSLGFLYPSLGLWAFQCVLCLHNISTKPSIMKINVNSVLLFSLCSHGRRQVFSCLGIKCAVDYFVERGHKRITAFVPAWRKETNNPNNQITDPHILKELEEKGYLVFTPSRRTDRKRILPYDDRFIVRLAMETNGIILSNDYFRDLLRENESWRDTIENRVLPYTFVENFLMIPDDPLGAKGPTLDEFLTCSNVTNHPSCPKPEQTKPAAEKKMCKFYIA